MFTLHRVWPRLTPAAVGAIALALAGGAWAESTKAPPPGGPPITSVSRPEQPTAASKSAPAAKPAAPSAGAGAAASKPAATAVKSRVVLITQKNSPHCDEILTRLRRPGGDFEKMKAAGWRIGEGPQDDIQIVDRQQVPDLVAKLKPPEFPVVACIEGNEVVRSFRSGCTTPLDAWTFGFLAKGVDERPPGAVLEAARVQSTGSYPLRGNHWSVEGDWTPSREKVIEHLHGSNHNNQLESRWHIDLWSYEELRSLHDDLHERYDTPSHRSNPSRPGPWNGKGI